VAGFLGKSDALKRLSHKPPALMGLWDALR